MLLVINFDIYLSTNIRKGGSLDKSWKLFFVHKDEKYVILSKYIVKILNYKNIVIGSCGLFTNHNLLYAIFMAKKDVFLLHIKKSCLSLQPLTRK